MLKRFMLLGLFAVISHNVVADHSPVIISPESVGLSSSRLQNLDALMEAHIAEKKIAGANVLIARKG